MTITTRGNAGALELVGAAIGGRMTVGKGARVSASGVGREDGGALKETGSGGPVIEGRRDGGVVSILFSGNMSMMILPIEEEELERTLPGRLETPDNAD